MQNEKYKMQNAKCRKAQRAVVGENDIVPLRGIQRMIR